MIPQIVPPVTDPQQLFFTVSKCFIEKLTGALEFGVLQIPVARCLLTAEWTQDIHQASAHTAKHNEHTVIIKSEFPPSIQKCDTPKRSEHCCKRTYRI